VVPDRRGLSDDLPRPPARIRLLASRAPPPPPPSRTKWTRLVHPSVLTGHVSPPSPWARAAPARVDPWPALHTATLAIISTQRGCAKRLRRATAPPLKSPQTRLGLGGARHHARGVVEEHRVLELRARVRVDPEDLRRAPRRSGGGLRAPRTKWTRRVLHPVLIGYAASLTPY
jgi:hypothetical protein